MNEIVSVPGASLRLRREPWDCEQLGIEAGKLEAFESQNEEALGRAVTLALQRARTGRLQHLAARVDSTARCEPRALQANGFRLVDTVVHFELPLASFDVEQNGVSLRWATMNDAPALAKLSADAFSDKASTFNRYLNDGGFSDSAVRKVYDTWARTSVGGAAADSTLVAFDGERVTGFLTLKHPDEAKRARVPLNAVDGSYRGKGIYGALVLRAAHEMKACGAVTLAVTTQLQQVAVQRTWLALGARHAGSAYSFHRWLD